jgi:hypothetical protein
MSCFGEYMVNTFWIQGAVDIAAGDLPAINAATIDWWTNNIAPIVRPEVELVEVGATIWSAENAPSEISAAAVAGSSNASVPTLPLNVALCISLRSSFRGRSFRGRWYQGGYAAGHLDNTDKNAVTTAVANSSAAAIGALASAYSAISPSIKHVIVSFFTGGNPRTTAVVSEVIDYVVNVYLDSQRRRLHGRGT